MLKIEGDPINNTYKHLFEMKVHPLCFLGRLSESELEQHECSDRIWVHQTVFERFTATGEAGIAAIVRLRNGVDQSVPAVIYAVHYDAEDVLYAPAWIHAELLYDTETVALERITPSLGTKITIAPHTSDHLIVGDDPQIVLRDGFEQYTCLVRGLDYQIWLGSHAFTITLTDLSPADQSIVCIRGNELELELLAPLDRPVTPPPPPAPAPAPASAPAPAPVTTVSQTAEERRATIAAATRRRLEAAAALSSAASNT